MRVLQLSTRVHMFITRLQYKIHYTNFTTTYLLFCQSQSQLTLFNFDSENIIYEFSRKMSVDFTTLSVFNFDVNYDLKQFIFSRFNFNKVFCTTYRQFSVKFKFLFSESK